MSVSPIYTRIIQGILRDRGIDADPVAVEDAMRARHGDKLGGMRTGRFISECVKAAREIEKGEGK
ncbi:MAG: hypothetical protein U9Q07_04000 [Planctomycetota bacterium]|nr:hypothetical protein [Planctomycetota bacterium]